MAIQSRGLVMYLHISSFLNKTEFNHWEHHEGDSVLQLISGRPCHFRDLYLFSDCRILYLLQQHRTNVN